MRTTEQYDCSLSEMETHPTQRNDLSIEYGLNFRSVLNDLTYFHVCTGAMLPDIFHDILEGVFPFEVKLLLRHLIQDEGCLTLNQLNYAIESIELGHLDSMDRPSLISCKTFR